MKKLILGIAGAAALSACGMPTPTDPDLACDPTPASATLAANVQALFTAKCSECHSAMSSTYGDYSSAEKTAAATVNQKSLFAGTAGTLKVVEPNSLSNSSLWLKVLGGEMVGRTGPKGERLYSRMPQTGTLSTEEKKLIKDWICSGAK